MRRMSWKVNRKREGEEEERELCCCGCQGLRKLALLLSRGRGDCRL